MTLILGIDPGSRKTGFGLVKIDGARTLYVSSGIVRLPEKASLPERLDIIFNNLSALILEYGPDQLAIEEVFFARDPRAALKLGQARGAAILAGTQQSLPIFEYSARTVKQSVVGNGGATKEQVQHMVTRLLKLPATPQEDAADGLAVALCHIQTLSLRTRLPGLTGYARGRLK